MILKITLDLPEDNAYLRMTREVGRTILNSLQTIKEDIDDVDTVISELYANVLRHGLSEEGRFQVVIEYYAASIVMFVIDRGQGFSFKNVPQPGTVRDDFEGGQRIGGYGLELVKALANRLDFYRTDNEGTTVRAEKTLHYQTVQAAQDAARLDNGTSRASVSTT